MYTYVSRLCLYNSFLFFYSFVTYIGTPYEMGFAHGTLMKENSTKFINAVWAYLEEQVVGP